MTAVSYRPVWDLAVRQTRPGWLTWTCMEQHRSSYYPIPAKCLGLKLPSTNPDTDWERWPRGDNLWLVVTDGFR